MVVHEISRQGRHSHCPRKLEVSIRVLSEVNQSGDIGDFVDRAAGEIRESNLTRTNLSSNGKGVERRE